MKKCDVPTMSLLRSIAEEMNTAQRLMFAIELGFDVVVTHPKPAWYTGLSKRKPKPVSA